MSELGRSPFHISKLIGLWMHNGREHLPSWAKCVMKTFLEVCNIARASMENHDLIATTYMKQPYSIIICWWPRAKKFYKWKNDRWQPLWSVVRDLEQINLKIDMTCTLIHCMPQVVFNKTLWRAVVHYQWRIFDYRGIACKEFGSIMAGDNYN